MKVTVELFGAVRHVDARYCDTGVVELDLPPAASVGHAIAMLGLTGTVAQLALVTVNGQRVTAGARLREGDVVRLISPVSAG